MRSVSRIPKILSLVHALWMTAPDMRFFQLLLWIETRCKEILEKDDLFYVKDDKIIETLQKMLEELS